MRSKSERPRAKLLPCSFRGGLFLLYSSCNLDVYLNTLHQGEYLHTEDEQTHEYICPRGTNQANDSLL